MKTISQEVALAFNAIEFKEAFNVLPLMNYLIREINIKSLYKFYEELDREVRNEYCWPDFGHSSLSLEELERAVDTLIAMGFQYTEEFVTPSIEMLNKKAQNG